MIGGRTLAILITIGAIVGGAIVWPWTSPPTASDGLAPTPPMGFNSWITTYCDDSLDVMIRGIADAIADKGLKDARYQYVNIDDCWALPERNAQETSYPTRGGSPRASRPSTMLAPGRSTM
ncbi:MAG: alpha-galactosidase [Mycobacterium sp.]|nr:alpha-galactosidase [Mycobacterium sp.]